MSASPRLDDARKLAPDVPHENIRGTVVDNFRFETFRDSLYHRNSKEATVPNSSECPSLDKLQLLALGKLSDPPAAAMEQHLLECDKCTQQTAELHQADTLVSAIRQAGRALPQRSAEEQGRLDRLMTTVSGLRAEQVDATQLSDLRGTDEFVASPCDDVIRELSVSWRPAQAADEIGRLGAYRILKVLGAGGMGAVFLAEDLQLHRKVALKMMRPRVAANPGAAERFLREARAAAALRHDHILTIYQVGEEAGVPYLAMEYLEGESLEDRLHRESPLPIGDSLRIGREIAEGLAAAHARGLIHRDIKPANVWLESSPVAPPTGKPNVAEEAFARSTYQEQSVSFAGSAFLSTERQGYFRVKLLDFGLARSVDEESQLTSSGMIIGTPSYMAPEQASGEAVDGRTDLFSLGVILYRMTTGRLPFPGKKTMEILRSLATITPASPQAINAGVPRELSDLIDRLLAKESKSRPESAALVARQLAQIEQADGRLGTPARLDLASAEQKTGRSAPPPKRIGLALAGIAALAFLGVVIVTIKTKDGQETEVTIKVPGEIETASTTVQKGDGAAAVRDGVALAESGLGDGAKFITLAALDRAQIPESERFDWQPFDRKRRLAGKYDQPSRQRMAAIASSGSRRMEQSSSSRSFILA